MILMRYRCKTSALLFVQYECRLLVSTSSGHYNRFKAEIPQLCIITLWELIDSSKVERCKVSINTLGCAIKLLR